jgi:hypothetical protein
MNNREMISFLMDLSDLAEKAKMEMRGIKTSRRVLSEEEHDAMKELILDTLSDLEVVDSDLMEYARAGFISKSFVTK